MACGILETWAAKPRARRDGLYQQIRVILAGSKLPQPEPKPGEESEGDKYLRSIGLL